MHRATQSQERNRQRREGFPEQQGQPGSKHSSADTAEQVCARTPVDVPVAGPENRHTRLSKRTQHTVARFS